MRFGVVFGALLGVFYLVYIPFSQTDMYRSYLGFIAQASGGGLRLFGHDANVSGRSIVSPHFKVDIVPGCDGMEAFALFGSAVLASPVSLRSRLSFMLVGIVTLFVINIARIVSVFLVGVHFPKAFETMHWDLWPGVLIVLVLSCWLLWARWAWSATADRGKAT